MSGVPPVPEKEFGEAWHTFLADMRDCVDAIETRTKTLEDAGQQEEELTDQLVNAYRPTTFGTPGSDPEVAEIVVGGGGLDTLVSSADVASEAGSKLFITAHVTLWSDTAGLPLDVRLVVDGTEVERVRAGGSTDPTNRNSYRSIIYGFEAAGSHSVELFIEGFTAQTVSYSLKGTGLAIFVIKE